MTDTSPYLNRPLRTEFQARLDIARARGAEEERQILEDYRGFDVAELQEEADRLQCLYDRFAALRGAVKVQANGALVTTPYSDMDGHLDDTMADLRWWLRKVEAAR